MREKVMRRKDKSYLVTCGTQVRREGKGRGGGGIFLLPKKMLHCHGRGTLYDYRGEPTLGDSARNGSGLSFLEKLKRKERVKVLGSNESPSGIRIKMSTVTIDERLEKRGYSPPY